MKVSKKVLLVFVLLPFVGIFVFRIYPIFYACYKSLYTYSFSKGTDVFVGLKNFFRLFSDPIFVNSLKVTFKFNAIINPIQVIGALFLAVLVNRKIPGITVFRSIFLLPTAISLPLVSIIWGLLLNFDGFVNSLLSSLGIPKQPFLLSQSQALYTIILIASWIGFSYWMIFLLAGLQEVPPVLYEASRIDGASLLQQFVHITLPLLKRPIAFVAVGATTSNFLLFAPVYTLTQGGPGGSTDLLMYEAYISAYSYSDFGRCYAIVVILLLILVILVGIEFKLLRGRDVE